MTTAQLTKEVCHCGRDFIKSKVNDQCFRCDTKVKETEKLLEEYGKQKLMLHIKSIVDK